VVGSVLALPAADVATAPPAAAASIPLCPDSNPFDASEYNCLFPSTAPIPFIPSVVTPGTRVTLGFPDYYYYDFPGANPACAANVGNPLYDRVCYKLTPTQSGIGARVLETETGVIINPSFYGFYLEPQLGCFFGVSRCDYIVRFQPRSLPPGGVTILLAMGLKLALPGGSLFGGPFIGWDTSFVLSGTPSAPPVTSFDATEDSIPGTWRFSATSTDPKSLPLSHRWDFGDDTTGTGTLATHTYDEPGTYDITLTSRNTDGLESSATRQVVVAAPTLGLSIDLLDGAAPPLVPDEPVDARVTVSASDDGLGPIDDIRFTDDTLLTVSPADAFLITDGPTPAVPTAGFSLDPGQTKTFDVTIEPQILGRYTILSQVTGTDALGTEQTADASSPGEIGEALKVGIALDPPTADQEEGPDGPEPVDVTATITFENTTSVEMTAVTMTSLRVDRTKAGGQLLAVTQTGGADPGSDGLAIGALAPGEKASVTATFRATDDAEVEFSAMATAALAGGRSEIGLGKQRWSVKPKYLLGVTTKVTNPEGTDLLPAGELIRVEGTVKNLSTTATLEVGPLYPTLSGNAGVMSLAWDTTGTDPVALIPAANVILDPGESRDFTVRILTTWSDPKRVTGPGGSGGTRADVTFTPYGKATLEDGTTKILEAADIQASESSLTHRVAVDDSISIPAFDGVAYVQALSLGTVQGLGAAAASVVTGVVDLVEAPYTVTSAVYAAQARIWASFTPAEREEFAKDTGLMAAAILMRNAEFAKDGAGALIEKVEKSTLEIMTDLENEWRIGDYTQTAQAWSRWGGDAIGQVVIPVALAKMARSTRVVTALARAQEAIQTRMRPTLTSSLSATRIEELGPLLAELASGTELSAAEMAQLYGVSAEEFTELKRLADKYGVLMTVRSRHASSIEWIDRFKALLKPETLKIKSVSELDEVLGYPAESTGSLVFAKPEPLKVFDAGTKDLGEAINDFVLSKGFTPGTVEWQNAVKRMADRSVEWRRYEMTYKRWDAQGWIDVSLNYEGNAIGDSVRKGRSGIGVAPLSSGKYKQFRLRKVGDEQYIVEMFNDKVGRFVPVTGDIDPIAFTHLDGSTLTAAEHADLLDDMAKSALLQAQHGESATYTKGGLDFVESQFKPGEPGVQIAPGDSAARVVRFNKGDSRWASAEDYHLKWEGGFEYSGSYVPRTAVPRPPVVVPAVAPAPPARVSAIPRAVGAEPNVGRCRISYGRAVKNISAVVDMSGKLRVLADDGTPSADTSLHDECFSPGPPVEKVIKPVTGLIDDSTVGATELPVPDDPFLATAGNGLELGDEVTVGAGTANAETHTITGFGSIIIDGGLQQDWPAGTIIVVTKAASTDPPPPPPPPPTTVPTPPPTDPDPASPIVPAPAPPGADGDGATLAAAPATPSTPTGALPYTGSSTGPLVAWALALLASGAVLAAVGARGRRRRRSA